MNNTKILRERRDAFYEWYIKNIDRYGTYFKELDYFSLENYKIQNISDGLVRDMVVKNENTSFADLIYFLYLYSENSSKLIQDLQTAETNKLEKNIGVLVFSKNSLELELVLDSEYKTLNILFIFDINNEFLKRLRVDDLIFIIDQNENYLYKGSLTNIGSNQFSINILESKNIKNQYKPLEQDVYDIITGNYVLLKKLHYNLFHELPTPIFKTNELRADVEQLHPVLFRNYYPTRTENYNEQEFELFAYIKGLKYVKNDTTQSNLKNIKYFEEIGGVKQYADDLLEVLNEKYIDPILFLGIPSSKVSKKNIVEYVIEEITERQENYINAQFLLKKNKDTKTAHESTIDARDINSHIDSWGSSSDDIENYLDYPVVVIDDVITSGSSFNAVYKYLIGLGFKKENLHFYSYGKSLKNIYLREIEKSQTLSKINETNKKISGIIFDLDQTIIESNNIHEYKDLRRTSRQQYHSQLRSKINTREEYQIYPQMVKILKDMIEKHPEIPIIFVTNNTEFTAKVYLDGNLELVIVRPEINSEPVPDLYVGEQKIASYSINQNRYVNVNKFHNLISFNDAGTYKTSTEEVKKCKPFPDLIIQAIDAMELKEDNPRIIGIGNTESDIAAYNNANIESVLANWGNQYEIDNQFNADCVFDNIEDFEEFLKDNI